MLTVPKEMLPEEVRDGLSESRVLVYGQPEGVRCPLCVATMRKFDGMKVKYEKRAFNIEGTDKVRDFMVSQGMTSAPGVFYLSESGEVRAWCGFKPEHIRDAAKEMVGVAA